MAQGVYVPFIGLIVMVVVCVLVFIFKGIDFFKNFISLVITGVLALMLSYIIMITTMPELFITMIEPWRGLALSFVNTAFGTPIALVLYYPMKKILGMLRWTKVLGGK